mmetsp:Transcript_12432/g.26788  ORF Transcript_12432/g.26788 Transcript_12432/m.26788 type:complete len:264 (-) Transcript_12432:375-1166(-)
MVGLRRAFFMACWNPGSWCRLKDWKLMRRLCLTPAARTTFQGKPTVPESMWRGFPMVAPPPMYFGRVPWRDSSPRYLVTMLPPREYPSRKRGPPRNASSSSSSSLTLFFFSSLGCFVGALLFNRGFSCCTTPRKSPVYPALYPRGVLFFTWCVPSCPRKFMQTAIHPRSVAVFIMERTYPKVESLFIPCTRITTGLSMLSAFVISTDDCCCCCCCCCCGDAFGVCMEDNGISQSNTINAPSAPIFITSRTLLTRRCEPPSPIK